MSSNRARNSLSDVIKKIKSGDSKKKDEPDEKEQHADNVAPVEPETRPGAGSEEKPAGDAFEDLIKGDLRESDESVREGAINVGGLLDRLTSSGGFIRQPSVEEPPAEPFLNTPVDEGAAGAMDDNPEIAVSDEEPEVEDISSERASEQTEAHQKLSSLISKIRQFEDEAGGEIPVQGVDIEEEEEERPAVESGMKKEDSIAALILSETVGEKGVDAQSDDDAETGEEENLRTFIDDMVRSHDEARGGVKDPSEPSEVTPVSYDGEEPPTKPAEDTPPSYRPEKEILAARKTQWSGESEPKDGVVAVDELSDYSDLILPQGAMFEVEDLHLPSSSSAFDMVDKGTVLSEIDEIWKPGFPAVNLGEAEFAGITDAAEEAKPQSRLNILNRFGVGKSVRAKVEEYDPRIHGPLVDLTIKPVQGQEEVELYPVNEPYAYIRIIYDNNNHEHLYQVIEPELSAAERELLKELELRLFETLDVNTKEMTRETAHKALRDAVDVIIQDYGIKLTPISREKVLYHIEKEFLGDGVIDPIMHDKYIEDISCDGLNTPIFVYHTGYESVQTSLQYDNPVELDSFVTKLAQRAGKYISIAEPMLDATMSDGSRIQMTLGTEVTAHGSTFTIRKFREEPITPTDLIEWSTFSPLSIAFIWLAVENGKSIIFAGGTASGKTTSLNAISLFIPPLAKIVTLEDTRELKLPHPNWIPSITRESFDADGKGSIDMYELLKAALRQRPEYILVGEVRGQEALTLFQAMSTGHVTYATMHADSVASVVHRLENPPLNVPRNMLNALHLVSVQVQARIGGQRIRRNKQLIEILDIDPRTNELITNEVFKWYPAVDEIRYSGKSYILEEVMEERGWSEIRMREELKRRQEILEWMRLKKLRHYKDVSKVLISYFRDPEAVMDIVRSDLYE